MSEPDFALTARTLGRKPAHERRSQSPQLMTFAGNAIRHRTHRAGQTMYDLAVATRLDGRVLEGNSPLSATACACYSLRTLNTSSNTECACKSVFRVADLQRTRLIARKAHPTSARD